VTTAFHHSRSFCCYSLHTQVLQSLCFLAFYQPPPISTILSNPWPSHQPCPNECSQFLHLLPTPANQLCNKAGETSRGIWCLHLSGQANSRIPASHTAVMKCHKRVAYKQKKCVSYSSEGWRVQHQGGFDVWQRPAFWLINHCL
jgi:hypothetical protein